MYWCVIPFDCFHRHPCPGPSLRHPVVLSISRFRSSRSPSIHLHSLNSRISSCIPPSCNVAYLAISVYRSVCFPWLSLSRHPLHIHSLSPLLPALSHFLGMSNYPQHLGGPSFTPRSLLSHSLTLLTPDRDLASDSVATSPPPPSIPFSFPMFPSLRLLSPSCGTAQQAQVQSYRRCRCRCRCRYRYRCQCQ